MAENNVVASMSVLVKADNRQFKRKMKETKFEIRSFGDVSGDMQNKVVRSFSRMSGVSVGALSKIATGATLAATAVVGLGAGMFTLTNRISTGADELAKTADSLGMSAQSLEKWRLAAAKSGVENNTLTDGIRTFRQRVSELGQGTGEATRYFQLLGLTYEQLSSMDPGDALELTAKRIEQLGTTYDKQAFFQRLTGETAGFQFGRMLKDNAASVAEAEATIAKSGGPITQEQIDKAVKFKDSMADLAFAAGKLGLALVDVFGDDMQESVEKLREFLIEGAEFFKTANDAFDLMGSFSRSIPSLGNFRDHGFKSLIAPGILRPTSVHEVPAGGPAASMQGGNRATNDPTAQAVYATRGQFV